MRKLGVKTRVMAHIGQSELNKMVQVEDRAGGASVEYYSAILSIGSNPWLDAVKSCL